MKKLVAIVLVVTLVTSFLGVSVASNGAKANGPISGSENIGEGSSHIVPYTATECVDLEIKWWDEAAPGDDIISILVNSCNISTASYEATVNVSICEGYYEIAFHVDESGLGPTAPVGYTITPLTYTGNYDYYPCIEPIIPVEVGGEVYPINKLSILAPWVALVAALIIGTVVVVRRRRAPS
jgi:hypothetical protein